MNDDEIKQIDVACDATLNHAAFHIFDASDERMQAFFDDVCKNVFDGIIEKYPDTDPKVAAEITRTVVRGILRRIKTLMLSDGGRA
jgi:hypothetical protein